MIGTSIGNSLIWDNGTNVGIGNTNTSYTLDVSGSLRSTTSAYFATASGSVGIGTTSPNIIGFTGTMLTVNGTGNFQGFEVATSGTTRMTMVSNGIDGYVSTRQTSMNLIFETDSASEKMRITSAGSVLIGKTSSTGGVLQVSNGTNMFNVDYDANGPYITAVNNANTVYKRMTYDASEHIFDISAAEKMRITSGGLIGIGTTSPAGLLSLKAEVTNTPTIVFQNVSGGPNSAISNFTSNVQTFTVIGTNIYVNTTANIARFNTSYAGCGITFDEGVLRFMTGTTSIVPTTRMTIDASGNIGAPNGTNIFNASDVRLKQNVTTITNGLDKILDLNPVMFNWIDGFVESEDGKDMLGFIAQEVQNVIPQAVENFGNNSVTVGEVVIDDTLRVNEKFIIPVLVKAIQEMNTKLDEQNQTIQNLQEQINILAK